MNHCSVCSQSCGSSKLNGISMQACSTRMLVPRTVQPVCSSRMHAQSMAQPKHMAVHPMGHPTSFACSRGSWVLISKGPGGRCLAASAPDKELVEPSPAPKTRRRFISAPTNGRMVRSEDELIREELMRVLSMTPRQATDVVKAANCAYQTHLKLHNLRGWISTLLELGLSITDVDIAIRRTPALIAASASGREERCIEMLQVMQHHGLSEHQILCVLRKFPSVLINLTPSALDAKLARLQELGIPPSMEKGLLEREPSILFSSLQWDTVKWLVGEGFDPDVANKMIKGHPKLLVYNPESNLRKTVDYFTWLLDSSEQARSTLSKHPSLFGLRQSTVHAKLAYLVDKLDIDVVRMMKHNYHCVNFSMDSRTGPRALLLRGLGQAASTEMYSQAWLNRPDEAFMEISGVRVLWEGRCRDVLPGAADLEAGLELCKEQWVREEKSGWEEMKEAFQRQWVESGVEGLPQLRRDSSQF